LLPYATQNKSILDNFKEDEEIINCSAAG